MEKGNRIGGAVRHRLGGVLIACALMIAACGGTSGTGTTPQPSASASAASGNLTVWVGSWWQPIVPKIVQAFEQSYPRVKLTIDAIPISGYEQKVVTATLGGTPPDVADLDTTWISSIASKHLLQPLDSSFGSLPAKQFSPGSWVGSHFGGKLYAVPDRDGSLVYFYNKTVFDEAHVPYPTDSWTYQDFLSIAQKLTVPGQRYGVGMAAALSDPSNVMSSFAPVLFASGGNFLDKTNTKAVINSPAAVKAITFWSELYTKYHVAPPGTPGYTESQNVQPLFMNNEVGLMPGTSNLYTAFSADPNLRWGMVLPPGKVGVGGGYAMSVPVGASNPTAARAFISWLIQPEHLALLNREPARSTALVYPPWNSASFAPLRQALPYQRALPPVANWTQMETDLIVHLQKVLAGSETPKQAADALETQFTSLLH
jgi:multiple sugar transport system substrate-binding protein